MPVINLGNGTFPAGNTPVLIKDTYLQESNADAAWATFGDLALRTVIAANGFVPLVKFDLSSLTNVQLVNSATLYLYTTAFGGNDNCGIHRITTPWGQTATIEGVTQDPTANGQATYDNAFDRNGVGDGPWAAAVFGAGDYAAGASDTVLINALNAWFAFDVTNDVNDYLVNGIVNSGWAIISAAITASRFASQQNANAALEPYLRLDYDEIPGGVVAQPHIAITPAIGIM